MVVLGDGESPSIASARLVFQNLVQGDAYARVALLPLDELRAARVITGLQCERVHYAADRGLCLVPEHGLVTTFQAILFGPDFEERGRIELGGIPSRARVSADGRYGAATVFVYGHSYADDEFSTQTTIIDMAASERVAELEEFTVLRDGEPLQAVDFNFWGVTFVPDDSSRFYATLRTGEQTYLVEGDIEARSMRVLRENVECPSISPDGTRLAFKKRVETGWRLTVLDLETQQETPLAEEVSVDDQVEWLGGEAVLYGLNGDVWRVPADGSGRPQEVLAEALSPAVVTSVP